MPDELYRTHEELIDILRDRRVQIPEDEAEAVSRILERENYYCVVNGYKAPFLDETAQEEAYKAGTTFEELYALFDFDRDIRAIYLKYILKAEHQIKTVIAHSFSGQYGHDHELMLKNFDTKDVASVLRLLGQIQMSISARMDKSKEIKRYMSTYGYVPLWVLVNFLTLGQISHFYTSMKQRDQNRVARRFGIQPADLGKYLRNLTLARNMCAHDDRFYDSIYKEGIAVSHMPAFAVFEIPAHKGNCAYGTNDVFSIAVILALLLPPEDVQQFIAAMDEVFGRLQAQLHSVSADGIMLRMGFGPRWKALIDLK